MGGIDYNVFNRKVNELKLKAKVNFLEIHSFTMVPN